MKAILVLALQSAWARRLTLGIALVAIALSTALLLAVERVRSDARTSFTQSVSGVDLVVGVVSRNRRKFRHPNSSPATSASRSITLPLLRKV